MPGTHMVEEGPESCKLWSDLQGMNIYTHMGGVGIMHTWGWLTKAMLHGYFQLTPS